MPGEYKKHQWLVYTACPQINQVGWPLSIAEAQAAGVGICMPEIRPDIREYIGDAGVRVSRHPRSLVDRHRTRPRELTRARVRSLGALRLEARGRRAEKGVEPGLAPERVTERDRIIPPD